MNPIAESRSCRSHARWTGVCPEGAQVRRRTGCSMKPLSSKKTTGLPWRRALFLSAANLLAASDSGRRRPPPGLVVRASGTTSPSRGASAPCSRGGSLPETSWLQLRRLVDRSKSRWHSRPLAARLRVFPRVDVSVWRLSEASVQDVVLPSMPPSLLPSQPFSTAWLTTAKPRDTRQLPPRSRRSKTSGRQAYAETPIPMRFLSFSYHDIRISTIQGSITG